MRSSQKQSIKYTIFFAGILLATAGVVLASSFGVNSAIAYTSTTEFCISCHEMESTVFQEYKKTVHFNNPAGVRASCADCHIPHNFGDTLVRKVLAAKDVYHHLLGTIDTEEKFEARRLEMAQRVWASMKASDSKECRNCHSFDAMVLDKQKLRAQKQHLNAIDDKSTCIDCHKGIAHKAVHQDAKPNTIEAEEEIKLEF